MDQLSAGGIIVTPIGTRGNQNLVRIDKSADGEVSTRILCPVRFVPLV